MKHKRGLTLAFAAVFSLMVLFSSAPVGAQVAGGQGADIAAEAATKDVNSAANDAATTDNANAAAATTPTATTSTSVCGTKTDDPAPNGIGDTAMGAVEGVMAQAAISSMCLVISTIDVGTSPSLTTDTHNSWFSAMYTMFRTMALWVILPLLMVATIHAVFKGSLYILLKTYLVYLPVSIIGGVIAVGLIQLLLTMTDDFSKTFLDSISASTLNSFASITSGFTPVGIAAGIPTFIIDFLALLMMVASIGVYIILVLREASVYLATAFIPLTLAFFVWPATAHFFKKLVEFLVAMIISKLVMVAGISLAVAAMASQTGQVLGQGQSTAVTGGVVVASATTATNAMGAGGWFGWLGQTMTIVVMFGIIIFTPSLLIKVFSNIGLTSSGRLVNDHVTRTDLGRNVVFAHRMVSVAQYSAAYARTKRAISVKRSTLASTTQQDRALAAFGVERNKVDNTYELTDEDLKKITSPKLSDQFRGLSGSDNPNEIAAAHYGAKYGAENLGVQKDGYHVFTRTVGGEKQALIVADVVNNNATGNLPRGRNGMATAALERELQAQKAAGVTHIRVVIPYDSIVQDGGGGTANFLDDKQKANAWANLNAVNEFKEENKNIQAGIVYAAPTSIRDVVRASGSSEGVGSRYES